jgi:hypothetical protein
MSVLETVAPYPHDAVRAVCDRLPLSHRSLPE